MDYGQTRGFLRATFVMSKAWERCVLFPVAAYVRQ